MKFSDFGLALVCTKEDQKFFGRAGTMSYYSPEMVSKKGYSYETDVWCLGIMLYKFLFGFKPFKEMDYDKLVAKIKKCELRFPQEIKVSRCAYHLLSNILVPDPSQRITLAKILNHPFVTDVNIKDAFTKELLYSETKYVKHLKELKGALKSPKKEIRPKTDLTLIEENLNET